ncbi:hypothetical protein BACI348_50829 [Bacillus altitudinis]|uniref:Uncharacterized protein n=1 Tax=Bacillus altitudinis TaxID=293387 RepID=A0A653XLS9_BACAB|nr:hypothetical protein BACI348_50829 [Bacillus altitudinis]
MYMGHLIRKNRLTQVALLYYDESVIKNQYRGIVTVRQARPKICVTRGRVCPLIVSEF